MPKSSPRPASGPSASTAPLFLSQLLASTGENAALLRLRASQLFKEGKRAGWISIGLRPLQRFFKMYLFRLGFLDGIHGLALSMLGAFGVFLKYAKLWELGLNHGKAPEP